MKRIVFLSVVLMAIVSACDTQNEVLINEDSQNNYKLVSGSVTTRLSDNENEHMRDTIIFKYKGVTYISECQYGDSLLIYDEAIDNAFRNLNEKPNVAIAVNPDGSVEFYDTYAELEMELQLKKYTVNTRAVDLRYIKDFDIRLWEDAKGRTKGGRYIGYVSNGTQGNKSPETLYVPEHVLIAHGFNNQISSFQMWGVVETAVGSQLPGQYKNTSATFYDGNFTGRSLTFTDVTVNKTYTERDYFSSFDFNDVTSSVEVKCF